MTPIGSLLDTMDDGSSPDPAATARAWLADDARGFGRVRPGPAFVVEAAADGRALATLPLSAPDEVEASMAAAGAGFAAWSALSGLARAHHLAALAAVLRRRARLLAELLSLETGRPLRAAGAGEVEPAIRLIEHAAMSALTIAEDAPGRRPIGILAAVLSADGPLYALVRAVAPALAAGCAVVVKPSERAPLTTLAFAEGCREAGWPAATVTVLGGDGATGRALVRHAAVAAVSFTGALETGLAVRAAAAGSGKALALSLRGAPAVVVHADADLDAAVDGIAEALSLGTGPRLVVQEGVAERFHAKLRRRMGVLRVGDPLDPTTDIGPSAHPERVGRVRALMAQAERDGFAVFEAEAGLPDEARFVAPALVVDVSPGTPLAEAGRLGPVVASTTFRTPDEAAALANHSRFGGAASVWSETLGVALDTASRLMSGTVWVNAFGLIDPAVAAAVTKDSGFGGAGARDGMFDLLVGDGRTVPPPMAAADRPVAVTARAHAAVETAIAASEKARAWAGASPQDRALALMRLAAALEAAAENIAAATGIASEGGRREAAAAAGRLASFAGMAGHVDGAAQEARPRLLALTLREPHGILGVICPADPPLLGFVSMVAPAIVAGNRVVAVMPASAAVVAALRGVLAAAGLPTGVVEILEGDAADLGAALAGHSGLAAVWCSGSREVSVAVERAASSTLKPIRAEHGRPRDWFADGREERDDDLRRATRPKAIWIPYGA